MKIAQVSAFWGPAYPSGSGSSCYEISKRLAREFEVHAFTSDTGDFSKSIDNGSVQLHPLRTYTMIFGMNPFANVFTRLMQDDFDIVHVYSYIFFLSNMAALAKLCKRKSKYVLHFRGGLDFSNGTQGFPRTKIWLKENIYDRTLGYFTARMADRVISVSNNDIPTITRKFGIKEVEWIPPGVDTTKFIPSSEISNPPVVTYVGKLESWKGIDTLFEVFKAIHREMREVKFLVVGRGSLENKLKDLPFPVEYTGHVPHSDMPSIYQRTSVLLLPSYMEGLPVCCIEALSCGVPVIATNVGDSDVVVNGERNGRLVESDDIHDMTLKTLEVLKDDSLRLELGRNGREYAIQKFDFDVITRRLVEIYRELL